MGKSINSTEEEEPINENLSYSLYEPAVAQRNITYNELVREVDLLEMSGDIHLDNYFAKEIDYTTNYTKKGLERIAEYYSISRRKKRKDKLVEDIIIFEQEPENIEMVYRRKKLWAYMEEIKEDTYLRKFLIFN